MRIFLRTLLLEVLFFLSPLINLIEAIITKNNPGKHSDLVTIIHEMCNANRRVLPGHSKKTIGDNILTTTGTNNISDDAKQCDASFLFIPIAVAIAHDNKNSFLKRFLPKSANCITPRLKKLQLVKINALRICMITVLTAIISLGLNQFTYAQGPGASWTNYRGITLSPATPSAFFQVKVTLTTGQYTNMKSDGSDLRFYDNTNTNCSYWIEGAFNTAGTSTIWVKVPTTGANALLMYYGNAAATAVTNGSSTFDFFDDFTAPLGTNWITDGSGGSVTQSSSGTGTVTLSNTTGGSVSLSNTAAFTPASSSFFIETKHREVGYNRNRAYAATTSMGADPLPFDYGYFSSSAGSQTTSKIFWNGAFTTSTLLSNNTDYLTRWQITDGSTYNWFTYNYATGAALDATSRNSTFASNIRYITFLVTEKTTSYFSQSTGSGFVNLRPQSRFLPSGAKPASLAITTPAAFSYI